MVEKARADVDRDGAIVIEGEPVEQEPDREQERSSPNDLKPDGALAIAARSARPQREVRVEADEEGKEGKDQSADGPPFHKPGPSPGKAVGGAARVVHDRHPMNL